VLRRGEELEVCLKMERSATARLAARIATHLLVDVSSLGTPSVRRIATASSIDTRLRVDGQEAGLVDLRQRLGDDGRFLRGGLIRPREGLELSSAEGGEEGRDVGEGLGSAPEGGSVLDIVRKGESEGGDVAEGGRCLVAPAAVGELEGEGSASAAYSPPFADSPHPSRRCETGRSAACSTRRWGESSRYGASA
jgi:hypothetical protein